MGVKQDKEHIKQKDLSDLQLRIDLYKESNNKLREDMQSKENKINHLVRENVLMKITLEQINDSPKTPQNIKKVCSDTLANVDKYKKQE